MAVLRSSFRLLLLVERVVSNGESPALSVKTVGSRCIYMPYHIEKEIKNWTHLIYLHQCHPLQRRMQSLIKSRVYHQNNFPELEIIYITQKIQCIHIFFFPVLHSDSWIELRWRRFHSFCDWAGAKEGWKTWCGINSWIQAPHRILSLLTVCQRRGLQHQGS